MLPIKVCINISLFTLSEILFAFNQLTRCFKSALTSLLSFLIELLWHNRLVSSAKWWTLQNSIAWFRSFICNKNRMGFIGVSLYRLSSHVQITEKSKSLRTREIHFVAYGLDVTFSLFSIFYHFLVSCGRFSEKVTWEIKTNESLVLIS